MKTLDEFRAGVAALNSASVEVRSAINLAAVALVGVAIIAVAALVMAVAKK